jgi:phytoene dehydrogenase-like protein
MVVATNAADRLDAIVIGANVEGLFAAACLAAAGKHVAIFDARASLNGAEDGEPCFVDVEAATSLDLGAHGLRYGAAPPVVGVSQEKSLVLWPDMESSCASIAGLSSRDADAYPGFVRRLHRLSASGFANGKSALVNWHLSSAGRDAQSADAGYFRGAALSRVLEEEFSTPLLRGLLAQAALHGCSVSPTLPGTAALLLRHAIQALTGRERGCRHVAGGASALTSALVASVKFFNTADIHLGRGVREIIMERDAAQGVILLDGSTVKAPQIISALGRAGSEDLLSRLPFKSHPGGFSSCLGKVTYTVKTPPALRGVSAAVVTSGATLCLNPSLERLVRGHCALQARQLVQDYCLDLHVVPRPIAEGGMSWTVLADVHFVPTETDEGPWSGNRRDRLVTGVTKAIEVWAPGFELSVEAAELLRPVEARSFLDEGAGVPGGRPRASESHGVPEIASDGVGRLARGLWLIGETLSGGTGQSGAAVARSLTVPARGRSASDA